MLLARVSYVHSAYLSCAAAATIAGRYACVRRQGGDSEGSAEEVSLIEWKTHQRALLPTVALSYCLHYCGVALRAKHSRLLAGDTSELGSLHIAIAGVKVMVTSLASRGMETCRQLCGGHGYSASSGIPERWATFTHTTTAEGDNTVMTLQVVASEPGSPAPRTRPPSTQAAPPTPGSPSKPTPPHRWPKHY